MKKILFSLFFICLFLFPVMADYSVDSISVTAEVAENGRAEVSTAVQLTFTTPQDEVTVPLPEGEISGVSVSSFRSKVKETNYGTNVVISSSRGFSGTQLFVISYKTEAFTSDGTSEDLYSLNLLSSRWAKEIGSCALQVTLPGSSVEFPENYVMEPQILSGYYGDLDAVDATLEANGNLISGSVSNRMAYDTLTLQVSLPDGYFHVRSTTIPMIAITWLCIAMVLITALCVLYWQRRIRSPHKTVSARLLLPEGVLSYQLPQVLDGNSCDFAALILEWANLGYLSMGYTRSRQLYFQKNMSMGSERNAAEQRLFAEIFGNRSRVAVTPGRFSSSAARFRSASRRSVNRFTFDRSGGNVVFLQLPCRLLCAVGIGYMVYLFLPEGSGFILLAVMAGILGFFYSMYLHSAVAVWKALRKFSVKAVVLLLIAVGLEALALMAGAFLEMSVGILACLFSAVATAAGPRRSSRGQDAMAQAKGCRRFYRHAAWHRLQIYMGANRRFFQLELPKAVALNSEKQFAARFERLSVPHPEWLPSRSKKAWSAEKLQKQLAPMIKSIREAF